MTGTGEFLRMTLLMSLGVIVGGVTVAHVLAMRPAGDMSIAAIVGKDAGAKGWTGPLTENGLPDPLVTGSVGAAPPGQTIILDPCTGRRR